MTKSILKLTIEGILEKSRYRTNSIGSSVIIPIDNQIIIVQNNNMKLKEAKKLYPKYQKWLLVNHEKYLNNKRQLKIMTKQGVITKKESDKLKSAILVYEIVQDLIRDLRDMGIELTIN